MSFQAGLYSGLVPERVLVLVFMERSSLDRVRSAVTVTGVADKIETARSLAHDLGGVVARGLRAAHSPSSSRHGLAEVSA